MVVDGLGFWDFFSKNIHEPTVIREHGYSDPYISRAVPFTADKRRRNTLIYGASGTGKTRLAEALVGMDVYLRIAGRKKKSIIVCDVHGDMFDSLKSRFAILAARKPELHDLIVLVDATHPHWVARFNPFQRLPQQFPEDVADGLAETLTTLYGDNPEVVVRMRRMAYYTFLALILAEKSLVDAGRFLTDDLWRSDILSSIHNESLDRYFLDQFPKSDGQRRQMIESTMNRLDRLIENPRIARMLELPASINWLDLMNRGAIVLINAPKGVLGEGGSRILAGLIFASIQQAALARQNIPEHQRTVTAIHADEYQNYVTPTFASILTESRKFGLELHAYTQTMRHINEELQQIMLQTVGNILSFRVSRADAEILVKEMFSPNLHDVKHVRVNYQNVGGYSERFEEPVFYAMPELWEREIRKLTHLPDRQYWWKHRGPEPSRLIHAPTVRNINQTPGFNPVTMQRLLDIQEHHAKARYGRIIITVEKPSDIIEVKPDEDPPEHGFTRRKK